MRVHERGAGLTEACGTGACAAAVAAARWGMVPPSAREIVVHMPGGSARVTLDHPAPGRVTLTGPATYVATIEIPLPVSTPYSEALGATLIERSIRERIVLVGVTFSGATDDDTEASLDELAALIDTAGADEVGRVMQRRDRPDPTWFIGKGKADELRELCLAVDADTVVFDNELSPAQQYNLEKLLGRTAIDRTAVILDIFAQNAHTLEGKAQVELALLRYRLPRLRRGATAKLSQQRGGVGMRFGAGETRLEVDRRRIMRRISKLETELADLARTRRLQRKQRARSGLATVTIVGYTNAGKSTLLNTLTDAGVLTEDRLFATLDPTTRRLALPGGETVLLTDTVGFVRRLPHGLVEAFKSTLEVATTADYLVHVVDASARRPAGADRRRAGGPDGDRRRGRAGAARRQQVRHRARRGQADRRGPSGLGGDQRGHRRRHRRLPARPRRTGCARSPPWSSSRCRTTGGTSSPRSTARGRSSRPSTNPACCGCGRGCPMPRPAVWRSSSSTSRDQHTGFVPPPYPYDRLDRLVPVAGRHPGGVVDLSIGTPIDDPPPAVVAALSTSDSERGYPQSIGSVAFREAAARWISRRFGVEVDAGLVGACVGHQGVRRHAAAVAAAAVTRSGHRALPAGVVPHVRDGSDARRLPGRPRAR